MQNQQPNPLLGLFDRDPGRWRPMYYGTEISVGVAAGSVGRNTISLNNQPYIITRISHKIVGNTADPSTSGLYQDGQYDAIWKDEQSNYQKGVIPADLMWGSYGSAAGGEGGGFYMNLPYVLPYAGNKTLSFEITNRVTRVLVPTADYFAVAICVAGIADWGTLKTGR